LTAIRQIADPKLAGRSGFLFLFVVRQHIAHETGDECLFQFRPVFVGADGQIDADAVGPAVARSASDEAAPSGDIPNPESAFQIAKEHLEREADLWDWSDNVEFLGLSWVIFV